MNMAQKAPDKVQKIIDDNKKIDILVAFKAAYPDASIVFNEPGPIKEVIVEEPEPEGPSEEELAAIAKASEDKAAKKAELEAQLAALDG